MVGIWPTLVGDLYWLFLVPGLLTCFTLGTKRRPLSSLFVFGVIVVILFKRQQKNTTVYDGRNEIKNKVSARSFGLEAHYL